MTQGAKDAAAGEAPTANGSAAPAENGNPETKGGEKTAEPAKGDSSPVAAGDEAPKKKVYSKVCVCVPAGAFICILLNSPLNIRLHWLCNSICVSIMLNML